VLIAIHLDLGEAEFWQEYESANEYVIAASARRSATGHTPRTRPRSFDRNRQQPISDWRKRGPARLNLTVSTHAQQGQGGGDRHLRADQFRIMTLL